MITTPAVRPPDVSVSWYRETTALAESAPSWLHTAAEIGTEAGLAVFAVLMLAAWWRSRRGDHRGVGLALLAPVATVLAYGLSELGKLLLVEERPCRAVSGVDALAACPPPGDWSLPSNHATIAGAATVALVIVWRRLVGVAVPAALLLAFSRVFVGVHYPHDVLVGLLLGAVVATLLALATARPLAVLVERLRANAVLRPLLASRRGIALPGRVRA